MSTNNVMTNKSTTSTLFLHSMYTLSYVLKLLPRVVQAGLVKAGESELRSHLSCVPYLLGFLKYHSLTQARLLVDLVVVDRP